ncbi:MAG: hypothetical protein ACMXYC_00745 [Candidatus Woesearchaeota archaeon]
MSIILFTVSFLGFLYPTPYMVISGVELYDTSEFFPAIQEPTQLYVVALLLPYHPLTDKIYNSKHANIISIIKAYILQQPIIPPMQTGRWGQTQQETTYAIHIITKLQQDTLTIDYQDMQGASGGLLLALTVQQYLKNNSFSTNTTIAGSAGVFNNGRLMRVGLISHKLRAAIDNNIDVFLMSTRDFEQLQEQDMSTYEYAQHHIRIIHAYTIDEIIQQLNTLNNARKHSILEK